MKMLGVMLALVMLTSCTMNKSGISLDFNEPPEYYTAQATVKVASIEAQTKANEQPELEGECSAKCSFKYYGRSSISVSAIDKGVSNGDMGLKTVKAIGKVVKGISTGKVLRKALDVAGGTTVNAAEGATVTLDNTTITTENQGDTNITSGDVDNSVKTEETVGAVDNSVTTGAVDNSVKTGAVDNSVKTGAVDNSVKSGDVDNSVRTDTDNSIKGSYNKTTAAVDTGEDPVE